MVDDPGASGNFFGVDPRFFQVIVPNGHDLVLLVNGTTGSDADLGQTFSFLVEGFVDTAFTDPVSPAIPEPSTWAMLLLGFAGIGFVAYCRKSKPASMAA